MTQRSAGGRPRPAGGAQSDASGASPLLLAVGGAVASGKSITARWLADRLDAAHFGADAVRADLQEHGRPGGWDPEAWRPVYRELLRRGEAVLVAGRSAILDGSFRTREARVAARRLARERGARFRFVECRAGADAIARRLAARERAEGHGGWTEIAERVDATWEPISELAPTEQSVVDTGGDRAELGRRLEGLASELLAPERSGTTQGT